MGGYSRTTNTYKRLGKLNTLRKFLFSGPVKLATGTPGFPHERANVLFTSRHDLVFIKGPIIVVLSNVSASRLQENLSDVRGMFVQREALDTPLTLSLPSAIPSSRFRGDLYE